MSLGGVLATAEERRTELHHYGGETDLDERFAGRNVTVERHPLPERGPPPFVVIRDDEAFRGAVSEADLAAFLTPQDPEDWRPDAAATDERPLYALLDDTVFASLERRQLLAASREIEERAYRVGRGRLAAGFQSRSAFDAQRSAYRRLASETDLDIHVYTVDDGPAGITYQTVPTPEVGRFWVLAFDGGDQCQECALVARQRDDTYEGVWTYDPTLVERVFAALPA